MSPLDRSPTCIYIQQSIYMQRFMHPLKDMDMAMFNSRVEDIISAPVVSKPVRILNDIKVAILGGFCESLSVP